MIKAVSEDSESNEEVARPTMWQLDDHFDELSEFNHKHGAVYVWCFLLSVLTSELMISSMLRLGRSFTFTSVSFIQTEGWKLCQLKLTGAPEAGTKLLDYLRAQQEKY